MITYKICLIVLLFTTGVLCRNTGRGRTRHRQPDEAYKYNHPPEPENYEAIPVAVVYEEDSNRNDKSIKSDVSTKNNVEQVNKEKPTEPTSTLEPIEDEKRNDNVDNYPVGVQFTDDNSKDKEQDKPASTFAPKSEKEQQIPVAVVYEPEASYYNEPRPKTQRVSNKRRKIQRRPPAQVEQTVESKEPEINAKEAVSTQDVLVPETPNVQEQFSSREKNIPTPNEREPVTQEPINYNYHKTIFRPTSNFRVSDKEEQLSNSEQSIPDQGFAKRDNLTRHREVVPIVQSENLVFSHTGDFQYSYEGGDGTKAFESGKLKTFEDDNTGEAVSGGFSYTAKDGNEYSLSYTADENGYQPVGAHLPTPPPIPPAIARALAYLATKPTPEPVTESSYEADYS